MKKFFSMIYETWFQFYDPQFELIFDTLFQEGGYVQMGMAFLLLPILLWVVFYYVWKSPYGKFFHWFLWLLAVAVSVGGLCGVLFDNSIYDSGNQELIDALADQESGYSDYAFSLPLKYALANAGLSVVMSFIYSLILKQKSKLQIHLPF